MQAKTQLSKRIYSFSLFRIVYSDKSRIGGCMNNLRKTTITTLEIAEMMEVSHADILKKLEGRKDRKGYIQVISEGDRKSVV